MKTTAKKLLFLDDDEYRIKIFKEKMIGSGYEIYITKTVSETLAQLTHQSFDIVSLDHDLGGEQMVASHSETGYEVAKFIATMTDPPKAIIVHTFNPTGAYNMMSAMSHLKVLRIPFNPELLSVACRNL